MGPCLRDAVPVVREPEQTVAIAQVLKLLGQLTKFSFFSISLALRARDSSRNVNEGPLPNLTRGFVAANHPPVLTSSERRLAKQGL